MRETWLFVNTEYAPKGMLNYSLYPASRTGIISVREVIKFTRTFLSPDGPLAEEEKRNLVVGKTIRGEETPSNNLDLELFRRYFRKYERALGIKISEHPGYEYLHELCEKERRMITSDAGDLAATSS